MPNDLLCPGCGGRFPPDDGTVHPYMTSSPGCWRAFGQVLADDFSDRERMASHQLVVDAYAAQHPGDGSDRRQVQSVGLHLMTLCLFLEHGADPAHGPDLHRNMIGRPEFRRLERSGPGSLTVEHVPTAGPVDRAARAAHEWAQCVWDTYRDEHETVRAWLRESSLL